MLEQIAYGSPRVQETKQIIYRVGDLEELSASALYYGTGGSPLGSLGSFGIVKTPLMEKSTAKSPKVEIKPLYSTPSKIFIPENNTPLLRYDPADENHEQGHLHVGDGPALSGIKGEEARKVFAELWQKYMGSKEE